MPDSEVLAEPPTPQPEGRGPARDPPSQGWRSGQDVVGIFPPREKIGEAKDLAEILRETIGGAKDLAEIPREKIGEAAEAAKDLAGLLRKTSGSPVGVLGATGRFFGTCGNVV
jgi:hypothetical protein